ncbi:MAG: PDR/VanB family oxidoreductase [Pseudoxanthomonas sp.]
MIEHRLEVRISEVRDEADGIRSFELRRADGQALPAFAAGAHVDVHLPNGLIRQYSLCNSPQESDRYLLAVLHEPESRGGSTAMHALRAGDTLQISAPRNLFALDGSAAHSLLFAGGIGITPILAMAEQLAVQGKPFALHYNARTSQRAAFLQHLAQVPWRERVHLHFDDGADEQKLDMTSVLAAAPAGTHLYVCGPGAYMQHVLDAGLSAGWAEARLHREYFTAAPLPASAEDTAFEVEISSSGEVFTIEPGRSIAQTLDAAGVFVPVSCEQGICGTCLTNVLQGEPDHRDQFLTDIERARNNEMLLCCSRSRSPRLVLDL